MYSDLWNLYSLITRSNYEQIWYFSCVVSRLAKNNFVMMIYRAAVHQTATVSAGCACTCIKLCEDDDDDQFFARHKWTTPAAGQFEPYLAAPCVELLSLKTWPKLQQLFVELNSPLPASEARDRLFSTAGLIFKPPHWRCRVQETAAAKAQ